MQFFLPLLTLLFIYLKLIGSIDWSWWLVVSPLYLVFLVVFLAELSNHHNAKRRF